MERVSTVSEEERVPSVPNRPGLIADRTYDPEHIPDSVIGYTDSKVSKEGVDKEKIYQGIKNPDRHIDALLNDPDTALFDNSPYRESDNPLANNPIDSLLYEPPNSLELYSILKEAAEDRRIKVTSEVIVKDGEAYEVVTYRLEGENGGKFRFATSTSLDLAYAEKILNPNKRVTVEDVFGEDEISTEDIAQRDITEEEIEALLYQASWSAITQAKRDYLSYLSESHGKTQLEPTDFLRTNYGLSEYEIKQLFPTEYHETAFLNHLTGARRSIADPDPRSLERKRKERLSTAHTSRFGKIAGAGKKLAPICAAGAVTLALTLPAAAVEPPDWDNTFIHDLWDNDPPSDAGYIRGSQYRAHSD